MVLSTLSVVTPSAWTFRGGPATCDDERVRCARRGPTPPPYPHLRSPDLFDVAKYPTITFVSTSIARTSATAGTLTGDLTLHGVTRTIAIPVTMVFYEGGRGRFQGQFQINRREYGINGDSRMNPIADTVDVQFNMSLNEKKS